MQDGVEDDSRSAARKCLPACRHFVKDDTEREQVGAGVKFFAAGLLGRHVGDRAHRAPRTGERFPGGQRGFMRTLVAPLENLANPKSRIFACPLLGDEDIGGLDVAMDDAFRMRRIQSIGNLNGQIEQFVGLDRAPRRCAA